MRDIGSELVDRAGELLASHRDISFQDMQSIGRAFRDYFNYEPPKDECVNDIIMSQARRRVIVHSGGVVDRKMIAQVRSANPRNLKPAVREGELVQFSEGEIELVAGRMSQYLKELTNAVSI